MSFIIKRKMHVSMLKNTNLNLSIFKYAVRLKSIPHFTTHNISGIHLRIERERERCTSTASKTAKNLRPFYCVSFSNVRLHSMHLGVSPRISSTCIYPIRLPYSFFRIDSSSCKLKRLWLHNLNHEEAAWNNIENLFNIRFSLCNVHDKHRLCDTINAVKYYHSYAYPRTSNRRHSRRICTWYQVRFEAATVLL